MAVNKSDIKLGELDERPKTEKTAEEKPTVFVPLVEDLGSRAKTADELKAYLNGGSRDEFPHQHEERFTKMQKTTLSTDYRTLLNERDENEVKAAFSKVIAVCVLGLISAVAMLLEGDYSVFHGVAVVLISALLLVKKNNIRILGAISSLATAGFSIYYIVMMFITSHDVMAETFRFTLLIAIVFLALVSAAILFSSKTARYYMKSYT
ncbi:MAG: hypothetical protein RR540_01250 [Oscillospiraceae bacterium]